MIKCDVLFSIKSITGAILSTITIPVVMYVNDFTPGTCQSPSSMFDPNQNHNMSALVPEQYNNTYITN